MKSISFIINTSVNTRDHVELLMKSLRNNLDGKEHEILVFIDSDDEDVYGYLKSIKKDFFDLKIITHKLNPCVGYARNNNLLVELAKHDIVSYLQSDMVIGPRYDTNILSQDDDGNETYKTIEEIGEDLGMGDWSDYDDLVDGIKSDCNDIVFSNCGFGIWWDDRHSGLKS